MVRIQEVMGSNPSVSTIIFKALRGIARKVFLLFYKREERLMEIIEGTLAEQTKTLNNVNDSLLNMKDAVCDVKARVEDIEDLIGIQKEERKKGKLAKTCIENLPKTMNTKGLMI